MTRRTKAYDNSGSGLLRQILDLMPEQIHVEDSEGRFVFVNRAKAEFFGMAADDMIGRTLDEYRSARDSGDCLCIYDKPVLQNGQVVVIPDAKLTDKDGHVESFQITEIPFTAPNTGLNATLSIALNTKEIKTVEDKLRRSDGRFKELADMLPQAVAEFDLDGYFTYGNLGGLKLFGLSKDEFENKRHHFSEMFEASEIPRLTETLQNIVTGRVKPHDNEYKARRQDGTTFPVMIYANPIVQEGKPRGIRAIAVDISERKRVEQELKESEEKYRSVVESSLIGFYIIQDEKFQFVNRRLCEITGYTYEEITDNVQPFGKIHPDDRSRIERNIQRRLAGEKEFDEYDVRVFRRDGKLLTIRISGTATTYHGRPAVSGTCIDVTRENALEAQLRQAQKMEAVGQLAGGMAHDFNNVLAAISGCAGLLKLKMEKNDPLQVHIAQILSATHKGSNMTGSLLAFSRKQPLNPQVVNLNDVLRGTEPLLRQLIAGNVQLRIVTAGSEIRPMVDVTQVDQILFNLVANAKDALPDGGLVTIETKTEIIDDVFIRVHGFGSPGKYAVLSVSDTGMGMDRNTKDKMFEPFFTTKGPDNGTGLGLSTVYGIVKQHKGYITVYSEENEGTVLCIYFPLEDFAEKDRSHAKELITARKKECVFVIERQEEVRCMIKNTLELAGYQVMEASDGLDLSTGIQEGRSPDLVIIGDQPGEDWKATAEKIKAAKAGTQILRLGRQTDIQLQHVTGEGRIYWITRPVVPQDLLQRIGVIFG
ncbi:MAG TPA: PAS domain S-box protein [Syntrophorhabdaceae bacterium]|nr:PAS domain S-box protein [Syntrophorhabdaceae bacterium]